MSCGKEQDLLVRETDFRSYMEKERIFFFLKILFIFIFREGRKGEREGGKHQCVVVSHTPPTGDLACNPGMCPDWESNQGPFGLQAGTQSIEPHQPGLKKKELSNAAEANWLCQETERGPPSPSAY